MKEFIFSITNRCNLRCAMCDIPRIPLEELSTAQSKDVIANAATLGFSNFVFSGGEPFLRDDIFELISFAKLHRLNVCITSNGCLIDERLAHRLSSARIGVVNVSLDGPQDVHDALRGEGVYQKAVKGLRNLKDSGVESTIATMVCKLNYRNLPDIVNLAHDLDVTTIKFQPFNGIFVQYKEKEKGFLVSKEELPVLEDIIKQVIKLCKEYAIATNPEPYLMKIPLYLSGDVPSQQKGCSALWTTCCLNSRGDIFPCWICNQEHMLIGSLKASSLVGLWDSPKHRLIRQKIIEDGCPGCLMSCYDESWGTKLERPAVFRKIKKIGNAEAYQKLLNRFIQNYRSEIAGWKSSYRFYKSFRGSPKNIAQRLRKKLTKKHVSGIDGLAQDNIKKVLLDIAAAKEMLIKHRGSF